MGSNSAHFDALQGGEHYLTPAEAATMLNVPERMIRRLREERRLRSYKFGKHVRFAYSDLRAYITANADDAVGVP